MNNEHWLGYSKRLLLVWSGWGWEDGVWLCGAGDCEGIYEAEGRATQWLRGVGRWLRVDGDCVVSLVDCLW